MTLAHGQGHSLLQLRGIERALKSNLWRVDINILSTRPNMRLNTHLWDQHPRHQHVHKFPNYHLTVNKRADARYLRCNILVTSRERVSPGQPHHGEGHGE